MTAAVGVPLTFIESLGWQVQAAITGLVFLLMIQLQFIISRTRIKKDRQLSPSPRQTRAKSKKKAAAKPSAAPAPEKAIDSSVFSKFQENLTQSAEKRAEKSTDEEEVVVSISSKGKSQKTGKQVPAPTGPAVPKPGKKLPAAVGKTAGAPAPDNILVESIGGMFDDISEPPEVPSGKIDPVKRPPRKLDELKRAVESETDRPLPAEPDTSTPLASKEILTQEDFKPDEESVKNEAEISLTLAESYFKKKDYEKSLSALKQFLENEDTETSNPDAVIKMIRLKGDCEIELEQYEQASKTFQDYFKNRINNQHPQYLDQLEQTITRFVDGDQQQYAVHFLFTALNEFRQLHEFHKMDELYTEIESAYHQKQDLPRLIQTYQNHLSIKKTIKDFKGQLDILDHLGKLLYDQGDDEGSRKCYEQRLAIESQMEKS